MVALLPALLVGQACQAIGGFEDFQGTGGGGAGTEAASSGTTTTADATTSTASTGAGGSSASGAGTGGASCDGLEPPDTGGTSMVAAPLAGGGCFWIDATEVTALDYAAFQGSSTEGQTTICSDNDSFVPDCGEDEPPEVGGDQPIVCVDWCDALAYCNSVGKRLCRGEGIGGVDEADVSEWYAACSGAGERAYPYEGTFEPDRCNGRENVDFGCDPAPCEIADAGTLTECVTPSGISDMSGNVAEWSDECSNDGTDADCAARGGSASGDSTALQCSTSQRVPRLAREPLIGFRCCADVLE